MRSQVAQERVLRAHALLRAGAWPYARQAKIGPAEGSKGRAEGEAGHCDDTPHRGVVVVMVGGEERIDHVLGAAHKLFVAGGGQARRERATLVFFATDQGAAASDALVRAYRGHHVAGAAGGTPGAQGMQGAARGGHDSSDERGAGIAGGASAGAAEWLNGVVVIAGPPRGLWWYATHLLSPAALGGCGYSVMLVDKLVDTRMASARASLSRTGEVFAAARLHGAAAPAVAHGSACYAGRALQRHGVDQITSDYLEVLAPVFSGGAWAAVHARVLQPDIAFGGLGYDQVILAGAGLHAAAIVQSNLIAIACPPRPSSAAAAEVEAMMLEAQLLLSERFPHLPRPQYRILSETPSVSPGKAGPRQEGLPESYGNRSTLTFGGEADSPRDAVRVGVHVEEEAGVGQGRSAAALRDALCARAFRARLLAAQPPRVLLDDVQELLPQAVLNMGGAGAEWSAGWRKGGVVGEVVAAVRANAASKHPVALAIVRQAAGGGMLVWETQGISLRRAGVGGEEEEDERLRDVPLWALGLGAASEREVSPAGGEARMHTGSGSGRVYPDSGWVYLSPDAEEELEFFAANATYIVGLVGREAAGVSLARARALGIAAKRLPDRLFDAPVPGRREPGAAEANGRASQRVRSVEDVVSLLGFAARFPDWVVAARAAAEWRASRQKRALFCDYPPARRGLGGSAPRRGAGPSIHDGGAQWAAADPSSMSGAGGGGGGGGGGVCDDEYLKRIYRAMRPWVGGGIGKEQVDAAAALVAGWDPCARADMQEQMKRGLSCIDIRGGFRAWLVNGSLWVLPLQVSLVLRVCRSRRVGWHWPSY